MKKRTDTEPSLQKKMLMYKCEIMKIVGWQIILKTNTFVPKTLLKKQSITT